MAIIGVNLLYLIPGIVGGTETYATGLINGLAEVDSQNKYIVFVNRESAEWPLPDAPNIQRVVCALQATNRTQRYLFEQLKLPFLSKSCKLNLLHSLGYVAPAILPCKSIVSMHDLIFNYQGSLGQRLLRKLFANISARRVDTILTISENSKKQIVRRLHVPPEKITVTYLAPKTRSAPPDAIWEQIKTRLSLSDMYLLALSSFSPTKNIPRLLRAFALLKNRLPTKLKLVLIGHAPVIGENLSGLVESLGLGNQVILTGYLADDELQMVLRHASMFIYPSLYEGFGIPVLEAMAAGVPVACSNAASLPEVAGDAALMFDPLAVEEIASAISRIINERELRAELMRKGQENAARFSWKTTAKRTLQVYETVMAR